MSGELMLIKGQRKCLQLPLVIAVLVMLVTINPVYSASDANLLIDGDDLARNGKYTEAIRNWREVLEKPGVELDIKDKILLQQRIAAAFQATGRYNKALQVLMRANPLAGQLQTGDWKARIVGNMASINILQGNLSLAESQLEDALQMSVFNNDSLLHATLHNELGNLSFVKEQYKQAGQSYKQAMKEAQNRPESKAGNELMVSILLNLSALEVRYGNADALNDYSAQARDRINKVQSHKKITYLSRLGEILLHAIDLDGDRKRTFRNSYELLNAAWITSKSYKDNRGASQAAGLLSRLYQRNGDMEDAEKLINSAVFHAQAANAPDLLYRWHWQSGRLALESNAVDKAVAHYRLARESYKTLDPLITWSALPGGAKDDTPDVFHYEMAALLLDVSDNAKSESDRLELLKEARDTIEGLKRAELQDYFKDDCVARAKSQALTDAGAITDNTMILYPIVFDDKVELLYGDNDGFKRKTVHVAMETVKKTVNGFREKLEKRRTREYLEYANTLYDWFVRPYEPDLQQQKITTLVVVPDKTLRALPFSALHDGKSFLIDKAAVVTSPGLQLTAAGTMTRDNMSVLLTGLTRAVQGYPALVHVQAELDNIKRLYDSDMLVDKQFRNDTVKHKLTSKGFAITHIASHGEFTGNVNKSFLLTYDDRINVNQLSQYVGANRFRPQPIDLLTLSACYTAAGDERAALGLAGITVKAGARSALATLWPVNDLATSVLMTEFYTQLKNIEHSKAQALQTAQKKMLQDKRYRHPGYWSPFILIGNWL